MTQQVLAKLPDFKDKKVEVPAQAVKARKGRRGMTPPIVSLGIR
jgi:hypothetical protein